MDKNGVTAFINSLLKARNDIHFGVVQNMKFSKDTFNRMRDTVIIPVLDSYFGRGGTQAMINVLGTGRSGKRQKRTGKICESYRAGRWFQCQIC